jgi:hypothetical protein
MSMRRTALAWWAAAALALLASAAGATTYAVVPLVGQQIAVVGAQPVTSTNLDRNTYEAFPLKDDVFDRAMREAVDGAVRKHREGDATVLVRVTMPPTKPDDSTETLGATVDRVVEAVAPRAAEAGAARLVVIAPYRAEPKLETTNGHVGTGRVAGLGLYVNRFLQTRIDGEAGTSYGFLGLFANFRVLVYDAATRKLLAEDTGTAGVMIASTRAPDRDPMNALTPEQKLAGLQHLLRTELDRIMPALLAKAGG